MNIPKLLKKFHGAIQTTSSTVERIEDDPVVKPAPRLKDLGHAGQINFPVVKTASNGSEIQLKGKKRPLADQNANRVQTRSGSYISERLVGVSQGGGSQIMTRSKRHASSSSGGSKIAMEPNLATENAENSPISQKMSRSFFPVEKADSGLSSSSSMDETIENKVKQEKKRGRKKKRSAKSQAQAETNVPAQTQFKQARLDTMISTEKAADETIEMDTSEGSTGSRKECTVSPKSSGNTANTLDGPPRHVDIDTLDVDNAQMCNEYAEDIHRHLLLRQDDYRPQKIDYMTSVQTEICPQMRSVLLEWMVEVGEEFNLNSDTLYMAKNYTDRILAKTVVARKKLQLVGIVALYIASKLEQVYGPTLEEAWYVCDNTYSKDEILLTEAFMLRVLRYDLLPPTEKHFLRRFIKAASVDITSSEEDIRRVARLSSYICELSILEYDFLAYKPATIALSSLVLALAVLGLERWTPTIEYYSATKPDNEEFLTCVNHLLVVYEKSVESPFQLIREKYGQACFMYISEVEIPDFDKSASWPFQTPFRKDAKERPT